MPDRVTILPTLIEKDRAGIDLHDYAEAGIAKALKGRDIPAQGNALGQRP